MARPAKDSIPLNIRMEKTLFQDLHEFCEATGRSKTATVELAVHEYMERENFYQKRFAERANGIKK